ncbi:hypothetical protein CRUP_020191 [Coryphaenoides rupestris]|nr:hypothetical protein CRUP_020191 [Coryphaenoides rupestris]
MFYRSHCAQYASEKRDEEKMCDHLIRAAKYRDHVTSTQLVQKIVHILTDKHGAWGNSCASTLSVIVLYRRPSCKALGSDLKRQPKVEEEEEEGEGEGEKKEVDKQGEVEGMRRRWRTRGRRRRWMSRGRWRG